MFPVSSRREGYLIPGRRDEVVQVRRHEVERLGRGVRGHVERPHERPRGAHRGVVKEKHGDDLIAYFKALKKVGGTWHGQTRSALSDVEKKALNEGSVDRLEIEWLKPRVLYIARHLALEAASDDTLEKAEKKTTEKIAAARRKMEDLMKNGPKEIGELDDVEADLVKTSREESDEFVAALICRIKMTDAQKRNGDAMSKGDNETLKKTTEELDGLKAERKKHEDAAIELARKSDQLRRRQLEITEKLQKVGATDGMKTVAGANEARRDLEEIKGARKEKAAGSKADKVFDPSVAAVKAKLVDLEKALAALGSLTGGGCGAGESGTVCDGDTIATSVPPGAFSACTPRPTRTPTRKIATAAAVVAMNRKTSCLPVS